MAHLHSNRARQHRIPRAHRRAPKGQIHHHTRSAAPHPSQYRRLGRSRSRHRREHRAPRCCRPKPRRAGQKTRHSREAATSNLANSVASSSSNHRDHFCPCSSSLRAHPRCHLVEQTTRFPYSKDEQSLKITRSSACAQPPLRAYFLWGTKPTYLSDERSTSNLC